MNRTKAVRKMMRRYAAREWNSHKIIWAAALAIVISFVVFGITVRGVQAREPETGRVKYYTSIQIRSGDTLWEIADTIADAYELDTRDCVEELKFMNNMKTDAIHAGNYLTVFYYEEAAE